MNFTESKTHWQRVSRRHRCPVCNHADWCLTTGPIDSPEAVICARVESGKIVGAKGSGWLHRLRNDDWRDQPRQRRVKIDAVEDSYIDFDVMTFDCEESLGYHQLGLLAAELGVLPESLDRLHVGWSARHRAYTFPMSAVEGPVRGIRLRSPDGRKWSVRGGRDGLFVPSDVCLGGLLIVCEGATDVAALIGLGLGAVGRPSCMGGGGLLADLLSLVRPDGVAIIADADAPGQRGARYLASRLVGYVPDGVRTVTPPAKDAREWVRHGATRDDVLRAIEAAPVLTLTYGRRALA